MRRVVRYARDWAVETAHGAASGWSAFWFTPQDPTVLGAIRILTGLMLVYTHAVWGLELDAFFGPDAWVSESAVRSLQSDQFVFSYLPHVPPGWLRTVHAAGLVVFVLFTVGCFTRVTSVLSFCILINYAHRAPAALFGLDQINAMLTLYLAVGPSGAALSLDRLLARYRLARQVLAADTAASLDLAPAPSVAANIALRLIQVHMCVIYLFAGMSKLFGAAWWDGTAIWLAAASYEYQSGDLTWLAYTPLLVNGLTHLAAFWELSYCVLVWPRLTRPLVLAGAVMLHMGIALFMGMITFGLIMLVANVAFVSPQLVRSCVTSLAGGRRSLIVVYRKIAASPSRRSVYPPDAGTVDSGAVAARTEQPAQPALPTAEADLPTSAVGTRTPPTAPPAERLPDPDRVPLQLTVRLPADAKLYVQNELVDGAGTKRWFTSRPARRGKEYDFDLRVEIVRDGRAFSMSQQVRLLAGQPAAVTFSLSQSEQASSSDGGAHEHHQQDDDGKHAHSEDLPGDNGQDRSAFQPSGADDTRRSSEHTEANNSLVELSG